MDNSLQASIQNFGKKKLRKVQTVDKSAPLIGMYDSMAIHFLSHVTNEFNDELTNSLLFRGG